MRQAMRQSLCLAVLTLSTTLVKGFVVPRPSNPSFLISLSSAISTTPSTTGPFSTLCLSATRAEESIDLDGFDDDIEEVEDGGFYEPCEKSFEDFRDQLEALAFLSSVDRDASQRAQQVFDEMYEAYILDSNQELWPNVTIYNLLVDAYAWSRAPTGGDQAQRILDRMEDESVQGIARPNVNTYIKVMEGWATRKQPMRAQQVFERLQARFEETQQQDVRPNTGAYNKLVKAWMKSDKAEAGEKAEALLNEMLSKYKDGDEAVKPNRKTWVQVMNAYGGQRNVASVEKIRQLLQTMTQLYEDGEEEFKPDTQCYNVLVKGLGQTSAIPDGAVQAEATLYEMIDAYKAGNDALRPNGATFVNVYNSFRTSNEANAATRVQKLLELQEGMHEGKGDNLKPDVRAYNAVLSVISRAKDSKKASSAKRILDHMKDLHSQGYKEAGPNLRTYNNILNACAYTKGEPRDLMSAFRVAVDMINDLRESPSLTPDPVSYGLFLRSCAHLMPPSDKREAVVENVFRKCCNDGQVGTFVLHELSQAGSKHLCKKLLGGDMESGVNLPFEWTRNVKNDRQKLGR